jgi:hypothetical protein
MNIQYRIKLACFYITALCYIYGAPPQTVPSIEVPDITPNASQHTEYSFLICVKQPVQGENTYLHQETNLCVKDFWLFFYKE